MYRKYIKRILDVIFSAAAIVLLSPLILTGAALVRIKIGKPVIFCQKRPGKNHKLFTLYKLRTMTNETDAQGNLLPDGKRLKTFGKLLRSTSLDELPGLFNIIKGDMSIVGPRPQLVKDLVFMNEEQKKRHSARPGLTGLAQVSGRNRITWEEKFAFDLEYIDNITFMNDVKIVLRTIGKVCRREGISSEGMDTAEDYGDYLLRCGKISEETYKQKNKEAEALLKNKATWKYYNHALLPAAPPDEPVDFSYIETKEAWKDRRVFFARWTEDFDCGHETAWWYCIKEDPLDLGQLKAKRRYEINRALSFFYVRKLSVKEEAEAVCEVTEAAMRAYGTNINKNSFLEDMYALDNAVFIGAYSREENLLCGYALCLREKKADGADYVRLSMVNVRPEEQKRGVNAAVVYGVCEEFLKNERGGVAYVVDGERNISHETGYQEYLEKYFQFRKAYCSLHIKYRRWTGLAVMALFPFRKQLKGRFKRIDSILHQEEIRRSFKDGTAEKKGNFG